MPPHARDAATPGMPPHTRDATTRHHTPGHKTGRQMTETEKDREKQEERERKIKIKREVRERLRVRKVHKEFHFNNNKQDTLNRSGLYDCKKIRDVRSVGLGQLGWGSWAEAVELGQLG